MSPERVTYGGIAFEPYIDRARIASRVDAIAGEISSRFASAEVPPLFICVLNGAFLFAADLFRALSIDAEITFIRLKSYEGTASGGSVKEIAGLTEDVAGRDVIVVEDIIDTGCTMAKLLDDLRAKGPRSLSVASLLVKPECLKVPVKADYAGFEIPPAFIIGYGLDLDGLGRNLPDIWVRAAD